MKGLNRCRKSCRVRWLNYMLSRIPREDSFLCIDILLNGQCPENSGKLSSETSWFQTMRIGVVRNYMSRILP
uniref:HTH myb-type domain-containing protein n=1 Tax=Salix viminalis TaxID=40686 RepID=A0A6N2K7X0_SALVM